MGPQLGNNLLNLGIEQQARQALAELGQDLDVVLACEEEPGLGNGAFGRLAACYLDSLATCSGRRLGTASATSTGSSTRRFRTAGRWRNRRLAGQRKPQEIDKPMPATW